MRNTAFLSTAAALLFAVVPVSAQNDFDALLGELTFGDTPASETLTLDVAAEKAAETLKPIPSESATKLTMPPSAEVIATPVPEPAAPSMVHSPAVQAPSVHVPSAQPPVQHGYVDMGQAFAAQECDSCGGGCDAGYGSCAGGCGRGHEQECETCMPYHPPSLPSSSFLQYFRSDACNVDVWNGFRNKCCYANKHTRGECDCFEKKRRGCLDCETVVYDAPPCEPQVCAVPSVTRTNRFFDFAKRGGCDDQVESCDSVQPACDSAGSCD